MDTIIGLFFGALVSLGAVAWLRNSKKKQLANQQSVILLDKIKSVCKFITVEGDFSEIYHYEDVKQKFLKLVSSKKKALVVINAKAHVGYDLSKIKLKADTRSKKVVVQDFPQPEVLSIETNMNYYDKKDGYFNKFEASDLTELQEQAKQHILDKIPESGLIQAAQKEALEIILIMEKIVETIGWKLDYKALEIETDEQKLIEKNR